MRAPRLLAVLARWISRRGRPRRLTRRFTSRTTGAVVSLAEVVTGGPNDPETALAGTLSAACVQLQEARQAVVQAQSVSPDLLVATHEEVDRLMAAVLGIIGPVVELHERMPDARRCEGEQPSLGAVLPVFREGRS